MLVSDYEHIHMLIFDVILSAFQLSEHIILHFCE